MKIVCLVPSLTETLLECGVNVVGRTRFCIHPAGIVDAIPKVGGTKGVDWNRIEALNADLVIFDREENLKTMADECPLPWYATHVTSTNNIADELDQLAHRINSDRLLELSRRWKTLDSEPNFKGVDFNAVPGQIASIANTRTTYSRVEYVIWRDPWMAVNENTFIASMLRKLGFENYIATHEDSYPILSNEQMKDPSTFYLFSSEPFPFMRHIEELVDANFNGAVVDGEVYSWFGTRSLKALQTYLGKTI